MASIIVVGGGLAGLACAWRLTRAGHNVEVLELEAEPGGRLRDDSVETPAGAFTVPNGASFFTSGQRNVTSVITALGLADDVTGLESGATAARVTGSIPGAVLREDRLEACDLGGRLGLARSPLLSPGGRLRTSRLIAILARRRGLLDPLRPELAARLESGEDALQFATRIVGGAVRDRLVSPALDVGLGCDAADVSSAFLLVTFASSKLGAAPLSLAGGLPRLAAKLGESLDVRSGCEVFDIETETGGARVRYMTAGKERRAFADAVVVAVPASLVPVLCPKLTPHERGFLDGVRYAPAIAVHLMLGQQPDAALPFATGFTRGDDRGLSAVFQSHRVPGAAPPGTSLLSVALSSPAVRRLANASDSEIADHAIRSLVGTPLAVGRPIETRVHRWHSARPLFESGALSRLESFGQRIDRSPRLAFAGDYLVAPNLEGALTSGMHAAWRVAQSLDRNP